MTPTEAIAALEKALEAGPTQDWKAATEPNGHGNGWRAGPDAWLGVSAYSKETAAAAAFIAAANPLAIRTLLDAHAGALRDAQRLDWLLENPNVVCEDAGNEWFTLDADSEPTYFKTGRDAIDAARAPLATNTKGADSALGPLDQLP